MTTPGIIKLLDQQRRRPAGRAIAQRPTVSCPICDEIIEPIGETYCSGQCERIAQVQGSDYEGEPQELSF